MLVRTTLALLLMTTVAMIGCKEPEPEEPPPPPLPTESAIYRSLQESLGQVLTGSGFTDEDVEQALNRFRQALNENKADPTLPYTPEEIQIYQNARKSARRRVQTDIEERLRDVRDRGTGGWRIIIACGRAFKVLKPDEDRYDELMIKAQKMINKPRVSNTGRVEIGEYATILFEIDDPVTGETTIERVREGQYFYNNRFRLIKIIGNFSAYEIEYSDVEDHVFEVDDIEKR